MTKHKNKNKIITYIMILAIGFLFFQTLSINANEIALDDLVFEEPVYLIEISQNLDFEEIKMEILKDDVNYIAHPEKLNQDVLLSEIVKSDIDYASDKVQLVELEVQRFADSKLGKKKIDSVVGVVNLQFTDTTAPEIILEKSSVTITEGDSLDIDDYVLSVADNSYSEVRLDIESDLDTDKPGEYTVVYTATDYSNNSSSETLTVFVEKKPEPISEPIIVNVSSNIVVSSSDSTTGDIIYPARVTRYGYDCRGCNIAGDGSAGTSSGIRLTGDSVRQANGQWQQGYTYEGYHIIAASRNLPLFSIVKISNHPFSGGGIVAGQPFYAIVADRGVSGSNIDLFVGSERNLGAISQSGSPSNSCTTIEVIRYGR